MAFCICKKPNPYFILYIQEKYNIDLKSSFVIGDHPSDYKLAINSGTNGIYLLTGHGKKHMYELPEGALIKKDILSASRYIVNKFQNKKDYK